jgi:hypothetical protein
MSSIAELVVALDVERQLGALLADSSGLSELPIAPLRCVDDLVRLELALQRFSEVHRSKRSKALVRAVRTTLDAARARPREPAAADGPGLHAQWRLLSDLEPAA